MALHVFLLLIGAHGCVCAAGDAGLALRHTRLHDAMTCFAVVPHKECASQCKAQSQSQSRSQCFAERYARRQMQERDWAGSHAAESDASSTLYHILIMTTLIDPGVDHFNRAG